MSRFRLCAIGCIWLLGARILAAEAADASGSKASQIDELFPPAKAQIDMIAIAERAEGAAGTAIPSPQKPIYYEAFDSGFIEAGPVMAGEKSPAAALIATALKAKLAEQGYISSDRVNHPSLALVYSWGVIRPDPFVSISLGNKLEGNFRTRLYLSAPTNVAKEIEAVLIAPIAPEFLHLRSEQQNALSLARDGHYFCIISAYDFSSATAGIKKLLWQVRLSALDTAGEMGEVISSLIINGGSYFGGNLLKTVSVRRNLHHVPLTEMTNPFSKSTETEDAAGIILREMMNRQRQEFSGEYIREKTSHPRATAKDASESNRLPSQLASRISAYRKNKAEIQSALSAQIKAHAPGEETRRAIDLFYAANAKKIAALNQEREDLRTELSRTVSSREGPSLAKSLDALRQEFAADVQDMDPQSIASHR